MGSGAGSCYVSCCYVHVVVGMVVLPSDLVVACMHCMQLIVVVVVVLVG